MACSKYTLTNTGSTVISFNYRRCDDSMWEYQVQLLPNETKNIWLINNTYSTAQANSIVLVNQGVFPPINATPTPTPTPSVTPAVTSTPTNTPTQTNTPTSSQTPTPTNTETPTSTPTPTNTETPTGTPAVTNTQTPTTTSTPTPTVNRYSFSVGSGSTANDACASGVIGTIWGDSLLFDNCTQFYPEDNGPSTMLSGFYVNNNIVTEIDATGAQVGAFSSCVVVPTPTPTTTATPSPTPTFGYYTYSLGSGATSNDACINFGSSPNTVYGSVAGGIGPNIGETLYQTSGNPPTNPVADGFYSNGTAWFEVSGGSGLITGSDPNGC